MELTHAEGCWSSGSHARAYSYPDLLPLTICRDQIHKTLPFVQGDFEW
jgi:hypothetical protein